MKCSTLTIFAGLAAAVAGQQVKILLLGDSITEITCWRPMVWNQLTSAGLASSVNLVGSMNNLQGKCSRPTGFDPDHEGHSGWQAYDIARNNIAGWAQNTKPDIVQFMLGTNDVIIGNRDVNTILSAYTTILNALRSANPSVKVIVDKLIPATISGAAIESLNSAIPGWVQQSTTAQSPIVIADCSRANGFTNSMLEDGVHPNAQGDQLIAQQVGPKLIQFIKDVQGGNTGPVTSSTFRTTATTSRSVSTSAPPPGANCAAMWAQCGGNGWSGPTCCAQGTCKFSNDWYSQCL